MHGFTDSTLRGDLFADLQWAMCISCGAWLSTHLFDVIAYQTIDKNVLINSVIPILRGSLNFFKYHIWFSSDTNSCLAQVATVNGIRRFAHTGPTTSPENSMRINPLGGKLLNEMEILCFLMFFCTSAIVFGSDSSYRYFCIKRCCEYVFLTRRVGWT